MPEPIAYAEPSTPPRPIVPLDPDATRSLKAAMLFMLTPVPCALAMMYGVRALCRITAQGGRGRGQAWSGIVLGLAGLFGWGWVVNEAIVIHRARQQMTCMSNLRRIGAAVQTYALAHAGAFPDGWQNLIAAGMVKRADLVCEADDSQTMYVYVGRGLTVRTVPAPAWKTVLFYDPPGSHARHVLFGFADGHVEAVDRAVAIPMIQALHDRAQASSTAAPATNPRRNRQEP
jgi:hypothetical protein